MAMKYFNQLKIPILVLGLWVCFAATSSFRVETANAEEISDPNIVAEVEIDVAEEKSGKPIKKKATAPPKKKAPLPDEKQTEPTYPNSLDTKDANDLDSDIFELKLSTLVLINEAYDCIFTPELITEDGLVKYSTLKRKRLDVLAAKRELKKLNPAILMMTLSKEQRIAFWINTYNFCTIELILRNYPIQPKWYMLIYPDDSIMQIPGAWTKEIHEIQREEYYLSEIEQDFLLKRYKDPRICFALSNASVGGPILRNEPYKAERLDEQLDDQVKKYLATDKGLRWDKDNNILHLSNVFQMNTKTFLESEKWAGIKKFRKRKDEERIWLNFILPHLPEKDIHYLETEEFRVKFIEVDWHMNETK